MKKGSVPNKATTKMGSAEKKDKFAKHKIETKKQQDMKWEEVEAEREDVRRGK